MTSLAEQQKALLDALFDRSSLPCAETTINIANYLYRTWENGLNVYQNNARALAVRTLQAAYPIVAQLVGEESFAALSHAFWHAYPPMRGDLAEWGGDLAGFIGGSAQLNDEPYLADVARVEWAMHACETAADGAADTATLSLLIDHDPAALRLVVAPGCAVLTSGWPVASIVTAHLQSPVPVRASLEAVGEKLRAGRAESAVVWRVGYQPQMREAVPGEAEMLAALLADGSLGDAVQAAAELDFNAWLPMAVKTGLLLGAVRAQIPMAQLP